MTDIGVVQSAADAGVTGIAAASNEGLAALWSGQPLFGLAVSVLFYVGGLGLHRRFPSIHPLFTSSAGIIVLLLALGVPYEAYQAGGEWLTLVLGPATVALGVPLYKYWSRIRQEAWAVCVGICAGAIVAIVMAALFVWLLGGSRELILTMMPKSTSSPIAIELSRLIGGNPSFTAVLTVLTGLLGSMFGRAFLRLIGVRDPLAIGIAVGVAAHGIGTAKLIRQYEDEGSYSAFAMALTGIVTGLLFVPIVLWLQG
ncbi:LrgB family protein [Paenibacillus chartarius]|uniref:LrgB family protein n=1 Tax=Paenibacillus chartarius TaxID=747481 RepID=A0ABV6DMW3_9BACL